MTELPTPMTSPACDLRDFGYMPLAVEQLLDSETWLMATGDEAKAAITLWCKSWHQVPAASLPNNDRILALLSGAGAKWKKVKDVALRGFVLCSDGRFYHRVLAEKATESWAKKVAQRSRTRAATEARNDQRNVPRHVERNGQRDDHRDGERNGDQGKVSKGKGTKKVEHEQVTQSGSSGSETSDFGGPLATGAAASPDIPSVGAPAGPGCSEGDDGFSRADFDRLLVKLPQRQRGNA